MNKRENKIELLAQLVRLFILGPNDNKSNPSNLTAIIQKNTGIKIFYVKSSLIDGFVKWNQKKKRPEITISTKDSFYRQQFTIAHEIGHLVLNWGWFPTKGLSNNVKNQAHKQSNVLSIMYRGIPGSDDDIREVNANEFAADFLMPAKGIKSLYSNLPFKDPDVLKYDVSERFNVSPDAAFVRLSKLETRGIL